VLDDSFKVQLGWFLIGFLCLDALINIVIAMGRIGKTILMKLRRRRQVKRQATETYEISENFHDGRRSQPSFERLDGGVDHFRVIDL